MEQFFIASESKYARSGAVTFATYDKGEIALTYHKDGNSAGDAENALTSSITKQKMFDVFIGKRNFRATIDTSNLTFVKAAYSADTTYVSTITIPNTVAGSGNYTIVVSKKDVVRTERSNWSSCVQGNVSSTNATIGAALVTSINNNTKGSGVSAVGATSGTNYVITITASKAGEDYSVSAVDDFYSLCTLSVTTAGIKGIGTVNYVKNLWRFCRGGRGMNSTKDEGSELYPGFEAEVGSATTFDIYTLTYSNPRVSSTIINGSGDVRQILHIAVPSSSTASTALNAIFAVQDKD